MEGNRLIEHDRSIDGSIDKNSDYRSHSLVVCYPSLSCVVRLHVTFLLKDAPCQATTNITTQRTRGGTLSNQPRVYVVVLVGQGI